MDGTAWDRVVIDFVSLADRHTRGFSPRKNVVLDSSAYRTITVAWHDSRTR